MRMIAEHRREYATPTELARVIAGRERIGVEKVRRWIVQADIDGGARPGVTSEDTAEIKKLNHHLRAGRGRYPRYRLDDANHGLRQFTPEACMGGGR